MLIDSKYYEYFGFTEKEVCDLCKKNGKINSCDLKNWYNGYRSITGEYIYNPFSVRSALENNLISYCWTETGPMKEIEDIINLDIYGIKRDFLKLITNDKIEIELNGYGAENKQKESMRINQNNHEQNNFEINEKDPEENEDDNLRNEIYSKMVVYGFLTYYQGKIEIPNKELLHKFKNILKNENFFKIYNNLMKDSKMMLDATLKKIQIKYVKF